MTSPLPAVGRVASLALLAEMAVARGLWWPDGSFAPLSLGDLTLPLAAWHALTCALAALCVVAALRPSRGALALALAALVLRCAPDRALWQPYVLAQCALLAGACHRDGPRAYAAAEALRWCVGLVFAWAGAHKLHAGAAGTTAWVPWPLPAWSSAAVAWAELAVGVGWIVPRARPAAAAATAVFSLAVTAALVASRHNPAVIPWNVSHLALAWLLAGRGDAREALRAPIGRCVLVVFGLLPALWPLGWPRHLAMRVYAGDAPQATLFFREASVMPPSSRRVARALTSGPFAASVSVQRMVLTETGAMLSPDRAVFRAVLRRACARAGGRGVLLVTTAPGAPTEYARCE